MKVNYSKEYDKLRKFNLNLLIINWRDSLAGIHSVLKKTKGVAKLPLVSTVSIFFSKA